MDKRLAILLAVKLGPEYSERCGQIYESYESFSKDQICHIITVLEMFNEMDEPSLQSFPSQFIQMGEK